MARSSRPSSSLPYPATPRSPLSAFSHLPWRTSLLPRPQFIGHQPDVVPRASPLPRACSDPLAIVFAPRCSVLCAS
uniref:Uncharacterized protein n=1 Tax=Zea mays TaxID=4577 RepID=B6T045_MAIZE|nr:hypothetical protein [Zea mays]